MLELVRHFALDLGRLSLWLTLLSMVFIPVERLFTLRPGQLRRRQIPGDLAYYFLNGIAPNALLILPTAALSLLARDLLPGGYLAAVAGLPLWLRIAAALVVAEVGSYWGHRWSHEIPFLWRFHAVHHSAQHIDYLVNTRAHPLDMVFTRLCGLVPIYVLGLATLNHGAADAMPLAVILFGTVWSFFIHANVRWRFGWLEWLISTPAFHHWHHTNDEHRDRNYAALLPFVDRLFGTMYLPRHWPPVYGIDAPMPEGVTRQLLYPLNPPGSDLAQTGTLVSRAAQRMAPGQIRAI
ncbi:MAG: sterol desaturase family protein, partial [Acetobacteraceae bacterium]|nr:sterol desaturase family protein [Acetobacteraceae bacterium]